MIWTRVRRQIMGTCHDTGLDTRPIQEALQLLDHLRIQHVFDRIRVSIDLAWRDVGVVDEV